MTCVLGVVGPKGKMLFGADSASTDDNFGQNIAASEKIWRSGDYLFGGAGSWRGLQLVHYSFVPPKRPSRTAIDEFMVTTFMDALRRCWTEGGHLYRGKEQGSADQVDTHLLVGYSGALFAIYGDLSAIRMKDDYAVIGSGTDPALGVLHATAKEGASKTRVLAALRAAERYNAAVRGPFITVE